MSLVDIGANLTSSQFAKDRERVIDRALAAGVTRMIVTGTSLKDTRQALALARTRPGVLWSTAGVHPHNAKELDAPALADLRELCDEAEVVAVGECGLDYNRNFSPPDQQRTAFAAQLEMAAAVKKPVFLHERDAHDDFVRILSEAQGDVVGMVVHCFTGTLDQARTYVELGAYIGVTGWICDERRGRHLAEVVAQLPLDRLLLETDAPYLLPRDLSPKPASRRNEPHRLPHIAEVVAGHAGVSMADLAAQTGANASRLFGLSDAVA